MARAEQTGELRFSGISRGLLSTAINADGELTEGVQLIGVLSTPAQLTARLCTKAVLRGELSGTIRYIEIPGPGGELSNITVRSGKATFVEVPATGFYGIGSVTVEGDPDFVPENIKNGVTILDVVGSYVPESVKLTSKSLNITANGRYTVTPGAGYDGMSRVVVTADVPQEVVKVDAVLQSKSVTPSSKNHTVTPDEGFDALSAVTVYGDGDLIPDNIKKDVNIFGVVGTYDLKQYFQSKSVIPGKSPKTVRPDSGYDALDSVYVAGDDDLIPANIREGVNIFGVAGSYSTGINFQHKSVTPTREGFTVTADEGYNALSSVRVNGDSALVPGNIADGKTIFGVTGNYVSPMKPITVIPSKDEQRILPAPGYYGFSEITVMAGEATGEYAEGYADGAASRDNEVEYLEERIETLTDEKNAAYDEGYEDGYEDGAASGGGGDTKATHFLYGTSDSEGNIILASHVGDIRYKGAVLPKLPEWDKTKYPYALITLGKMFGLYYADLFVMESYSFDSTLTMSGAGDGVYFNNALQFMSNNAQDITGINEWGEGNAGRVSISFEEAIWANFDLVCVTDKLKPVGEVYLPASTPIPLASDEPVAAVYGDVKLPVIDTVYTEGLKAQYPYWHIGYVLGVYKVSFTSTQLWYDDPFYYIAGGTKYITYGCHEGDEAWNYLGDGEYSENVAAMGPNWVGYDVINKADNSVYLAAYEPIPVYEQKE